MQLVRPTSVSLAPCAEFQNQQTDSKNRFGGLAQVYSMAPVWGDWSTARPILFGTETLRDRFALTRSCSAGQRERDIYTHITGRNCHMQIAYQRPKPLRNRRAGTRFKAAGRDVNASPSPSLVHFPDNRVALQTQDQEPLNNQSKHWQQ